MKFLAILIPFFLVFEVSGFNPQSFSTNVKRGKRLAKRNFKQKYAPMSCQSYFRTSDIAFFDLWINQGLPIGLDQSDKAGFRLGWVSAMNKALINKSVQCDRNLQATHEATECLKQYKTLLKDLSNMQGEEREVYEIAKKLKTYGIALLINESSEAKEKIIDTFLLSQSSIDCAAQLKDF